MKQRLRRAWQFLKIKQKIRLYTNIVLWMVFLSIILAVWVIKTALYDFSSILNENFLVNNFVQSIEREASLFESCVRTGGEENYMALLSAIEDTEKSIAQLPFTYESIRETRYVRTWSIRNMYQVYREKRTEVLEMEKKSRNYVAALYRVYEIQEYLQSYAKLLLRETLEDSISAYAGKVRVAVAVPVLIILFELIFFLYIRKMSELMNISIVSPVTELAEASRKIAENDFFIEDVCQQSGDELGELVRAFNKMKYATGEYITALEERRKALDLYHAEEMEKLEMARRLDAMELDLLKSQINPHFLFNTLNVIGGMASLEGAHTTEKMIQSLSFLFRYNLKTPEEKVPLERELKVVNDYMFLQEMRFGSRITYQVDCQVDARQVLIPTFTFQPLVENAIIHGLAPKEEGGKILIRIKRQRDMLCILVADNGNGLSRLELRELKQKLRKEETERTGKMGIGLLNIDKRVHSMYHNGKMQIYSRAGAGTVIHIQIPEGRESHFGKGEIPPSDCG